MIPQRVSQFDLVDYLERQSAVIDLALERWLKESPGELTTIERAMRYGVFPGGKRIRPILTLAAGELFGAKQSCLLPFACAIEMIHAYSLIHDDLPALDNDDLRRGEPTAHKVFGDGMALLAGDGLLTQAFHVISSLEAVNQLPATLVLRLIHELSQAVGVTGLVGGQALDLQAENKSVDLAGVESIHTRKTGALLRVSICIGAEVGGATGEDLARISRFGERLGLGFQIADDILDALGDTAESSRKEKNKATYPAVVGIVGARAKLRQLLRQCLSDLAPYGERGQPLKALARHVLARAIQEEQILPGEEIDI